MKRVVVALSLLFVTGLALPSSVPAALITQWNFEGSTTPTDQNNSSMSPIVSASTGTGEASGVHVSPATDWSTPPGNGSDNSFSSNNWAVGDYYQFSTSTSGFEDITLSWAQTSSGTGPGQFTLAYQVNGGGFTDSHDYTVLPLSWSSGAAVSDSNFNVDLSAITALVNAPTVNFRLIARTTVSANGEIVAATGTSRVDNFTMSGTAVPEPSSLALLGVVGAMGLIWARFARLRPAAPVP